MSCGSSPEIHQCKKHSALFISNISNKQYFPKVLNLHLFGVFFLLQQLHFILLAVLRLQSYRFLKSYILSGALIIISMKRLRFRPLSDMEG